MGTLKSSNKIILLIVLGLFLSCNKSSEKSKQPAINNTLKEKRQSKKVGFTSNCGSGCALVYNEVSRKVIEGNYELKFKVALYINEEVSDQHYEIYLFEYDTNKELISIHLKNENENILKDNKNQIREDLKKVGEELSKQ